MNDYKIRDDYYVIHLSSIKYPGRIALVDKDDFELVRGYTWYPDPKKNLYAKAKAKRNGKWTVIRLHRLLNPDWKMTDHIWHDPKGFITDNRRSNLRECTNSKNQMNRIPNKDSSSRFKGVYYQKTSGKYLAAIWYDKKNHHIGLFKNEIDAAKAYNDKAKKRFKDFAHLNDV